MQTRDTPRRPGERVNLYFNITNACNNACVFCASDSQDVNRRDIPTRVICAAFDEFDLGPEDEIIINGGEPTIHPGLQTIIREGVKRGAQVILFTNGRLLQNLDYSKAILSPGIFRVSIPLYAHLDTIHDHVTCRLGSFRQTLRGIRNVFAVRALTGYPKQIELKLLAARPCLPEWAGTVDLITTELGCPDHIVLSGLILSNSVLSCRGGLIPPAVELRQHVNDALDRLWHWGIPTLLWAIPLCLLSDCNLARYRRIAWQIKHEPQGIYFDPDWKRRASAIAPIREIYFDPDYPNGIEPESHGISAIPEPCRECVIMSVCEDATGFFSEVLALSTDGPV